MKDADEFSLEAEDAPRGLIGDNSKDPHAIAFDEARAANDAFLAGATIWEKRAAMTDAELEQVDLVDLGARLNDFVTGARKRWKQTDDARAAEKKQHDDAAKLVQAKWKPLLGKLEAVGELGKKFAERILAIQSARAREAAAQAAAEQRAAEEKARAAEAAVAKAKTIQEKLDAQELADAHRETVAAKTAEVAEASAPVKLGSSTGTANRRGLRTVYEARVMSQPRALAYFKDRPEVGALLCQLAERELRSAPVIDGVKQIPSIPGIEFIASEKV